MTLSDYLKETNTTQAAFGKKIGRSQQLVSAYCRGVKPPLNTAQRIVRVTNNEVTLADLWPGVKIS